MISTIHVCCSIEAMSYRKKLKESEVTERMKQIVTKSSSPTIQAFKANNEPINIDITIEYDNTGVTILDSSLDVTGFKVSLTERCINREFSYTRFMIYGGLNGNMNILMDGMFLGCTIHTITDINRSLKDIILGKLGLVSLWLSTATDNNSFSLYQTIPHIFKSYKIV